MYNIIYFYKLVLICFIVIGIATFVQFLLFFTIYNKILLIGRIIEPFTYLLFLISYLYTCLINPGIPDKQYIYNSTEIKDNVNYYYCKICNILYPKKLKVYHCERCNICIMNYDRHCLWTGNCIGEKNLYSFYFFLFFLFIYCFSVFGYYALYVYSLYQNFLINNKI